MSDYTKIYDGAALDTAEATIAGADFDVDFNALEVAVATKADKVSGHTTNSIGLVDVNGNLLSSEVTISTDGTMAGNSDSDVPTEKAVVTYVEQELAGTGLYTRLVTPLLLANGSSNVLQTLLDMSVVQPSISAESPVAIIVAANISISRADASGIQISASLQVDHPNSTSDGKQRVAASGITSTTGNNTIAKGNNTMIVGVDSNSDFHYSVSFTNLGTGSWDLYIIGYYK